MKRWVIAIAFVLVGCTSSTPPPQWPPSQDVLNKQIQSIAAGQLCVQQQIIAACGPTALTVLPQVIVGGAGAAAAGTAVGACVLLNLPKANSTCGVFVAAPVATP
jgi:hypothetical protein